MGTGFTADSPLRVARLGISSVISLVDDGLLERLRGFHAERAGEAYEEIGPREEDRRARRITAYLDLLDHLIGRQVEQLQAGPFESGSEITRYFELLPEGPLARAYRGMQALPEGAEREAVQQALRRLAGPGSIDVNVMTKLDRSVGPDGVDFGPESSDALAAVRGYAKSGLRSSLVLSAGMNPRLFSYIGALEGFAPDADGELRKHVVLKVSDSRSALIPGTFLAKKGVWISEYRVESGLNCGGHAFPTKGLLMGPILEEFRQHREELVDALHALYTGALGSAGADAPSTPRAVRITVQGGIGTAAEHALMLEHFGVDSVGWGTPFLLVPEVTGVDADHLERLCNATGRDVFLSEASPLSVPFWNLRDSASERARRERIARGRPGSTCPNGYAVTTTEFREVPECLSARAYQKPKLRALDDAELDDRLRERMRESLLAKSCICNDLAGGIMQKLSIDPDATPAICPGPGIRDFSRVAGLDEMVGHIYGRGSLPLNPERPHTFVFELGLYLDYLRDECERVELGFSTHKPKYLHEFRSNLLAGIEYYRSFCEALLPDERAGFLASLEKLGSETRTLPLPAPA